MKKIIKLDRYTVVDLASRIRKEIASYKGNYDALKAVSRLLSSELGDYFGPEILQYPDELLISFIELLDQIVFETEENAPVEESIRDYIVDDLYLRLCKYLDILHDRELYKQNLGNGILTHDDTVIIRYFSMEEYIPELIDGYSDRPALKKSILRALIPFQSEELFAFYYRILKDDGCLEAKILSLVGLKIHGSKFSNWKSLLNDDPDFNTLVEYASDFNAGQMIKNKLPENPYALIFAVNFIEQSVKSIKTKETVRWAVDVLRKISGIEIPSPHQSDMYLSIANILLYCDHDIIREVMKDESVLKSFIYLLDLLPPETFRRVTMALSILGGDFTDSVNRLISSGKVSPHEGESNILGYLLWGREAVIL